MRIMPSRYTTQARPVQVKRAASRIGHVSAPLKGMSLSSKLTPGDPLTATILKNFVVEDDRVACRAGYRRLITTPGGQPIWHLIPHYGQPQRLAAATNNTLVNAFTGIPLQGGFTSNDWHWTSFSNLGEADYTVMVNGADGVWSWDGGLVPDPPPVPVLSLSDADPAVVTVNAADIGRFSNGMVVTIAGAAGAAMEVANGPHVIGSVNSPANTFTLVGVNTSSASGPQTTGVTADPPGSFSKELVTAPTTDPWIVPDQFQIVLSHMNRLWFADSTNLAVYYLPLQAKSGAVTPIPLNAVFKRGGSIRAMYTWSIDGGMGLDDKLVIFTTNGECAIYSGIDPDTDLGLQGVYRFDAPMSKHSVVNYGGDLYVLISTGLVPLSTMMRAESEQLGKEDRTVISLFLPEATQHRTEQGWMAFLNPSSGRLFCNIPQGAANRYMQMVRHMPRPVWSQFVDVPARCWGWIDPYLYFGDDSGNVYEMHPNHLNDNGQPIIVDIQPAWSLYKSVAQKHFKMVLPHIITDGVPRPFLDFRVDYDTSPPVNQPDVTEGNLGAIWDLAEWDVDYWAQEARTVNNWQGVAALGRVGAPRLTAAILNCQFAIAGFDVLYEPGAAL